MLIRWWLGAELKTDMISGVKDSPDNHYMGRDVKNPASGITTK